MTQNTFTIVTRINPKDLDALDQLLTGIGEDLDKNQYLKFAKIASLHMAAIMIATATAPASAWEVFILGILFGAL